MTGERVYTVFVREEDVKVIYWVQNDFKNIYPAVVVTNFILPHWNKTFKMFSGNSFPVPFSCNYFSNIVLCSIIFEQINKYVS